MDLKEVRKIIIQAIAVDDELMELLVLKGGNALDIVHMLNARASVDIDFSVTGDFEKPKEIERKLFAALSDRFDSAGYVVFDTKFGPRPRRSTENPRWGGYEAEFKLISKNRFKELHGNLQSIRSASVAIGDPSSTRKFVIQISKYEWVDGAIKMELDGFEFRVYSLPMIAVEKIRAICQQMGGYPQVRTPRPRPRDFFDIYAIMQRQPLDFSSAEIQGLVVAMFEAKEVPLLFLSELKGVREFHRPDWPAVQASVTGKTEPFDFYFDFVATQVEKLKSLWIK